MILSLAALTQYHVRVMVGHIDTPTHVDSVYRAGIASRVNDL